MLSIKKNKYGFRVDSLDSTFILEIKGEEINLRSTALGCHSRALGIEGELPLRARAKTNFFSNPTIKKMALELLKNNSWYIMPRTKRMLPRYMAILKRLGINAYYYKHCQDIIFKVSAHTETNENMIFNF